MDMLWLGYDGLSIPLSRIVAVVHYRQAWDSFIVRTYGQVPPNVRTIVVTDDGGYYPALRSLDDLHRRWASWRQGGAGES
jgi:hypothetical protein